MEVKNGWFDTPDGAHIYYESCGAGPLTVFFAPGFASSTRYFCKNIPVIAEKYRVVSFDPRCYGMSSAPLYGNNLTGHATDIRNLIDYLELENVVLIGWSCGGGTAVQYSKLFQDHKLKGIGILDSHIHMMDDGDWNIHPNKGHKVRQMKKNYWAWLKGPEGMHLNTAFGPANKNANIPSGLSPEDEANFEEDGAMLFPWAGIELQIDYNLTNNLPQLSKITVPVILYQSPLYGEKLWEIYDREIKTYHEMHKFESSHYLFYHEAKRFNEITLDFLDKLQSM